MNRFSTRRMLLLAWMALFPVVIVAWHSRVADLYSRMGLLASVIGIFIGVPLLAWRRPLLRNAILAVYTILAVLLVLPFSQSYDRSRLRLSYCRALANYRDCRYYWGGEGRFGIDCSGLVRRGLVDALVREGLLTLDPFLVRNGLWLWWNDGTAATMAAGYHGRTHKVATAAGINRLDHTQLLPGDLAVTQSGIHVLAYLGDHRWISADPGIAKVIINAPADQTNSYLSQPVFIVRWKILDD